jgi:hypothetical protein
MVEGQQPGGAVARQVMQPHHAPVGVFRQRLERQQFACVGERVGVVAGLLGHVAQLDQRRAHAAVAPLALLREPRSELATDLVRHTGQHVVGVEQVVAHAVGQRERAAADDQRFAELAAQLEQSLAQRVARGFGFAVGPQQLRQAGSGRRSFEGEPGQQRRIARGQRHRAQTGALHAGHAGKLQFKGLAGVGHHRGSVRAQSITARVKRVVVSPAL